MHVRDRRAAAVLLVVRRRSTEELVVAEAWSQIPSTRAAKFERRVELIEMLPHVHRELVTLFDRQRSVLCPWILFQDILILRCSNTSFSKYRRLSDGIMPQAALAIVISRPIFMCLK
jgi:hypothetical protein